MSKNKKSLARQSGKIIQHIIHSQNQKKRGKQSLRSHKIVDDEGEKDDSCWDENIDNLLLEEEEEDEDNQVEENSLPENGDAYKEMKVPILTQTSQDEILVNMNDSSEEIPPLNEINSPEEVLPRKVRDKKMCHCINSRVFPHRRKKCLLAKTLLTMTNRGSLDLPQKEMLTYSLNISSSSDSEEEKELEKKQCDCINSTLFPHRREKCLLRNTLSSKSNAIVSDLQDSNVNKLQQVEPSSPRSSGSDSDNLESYILESSSTSSNDSDDASLPKNIKKKKRKNSFWKQISVLSGMNSTINGFLSSKNSKVSTKSEEANLIEEANTSTRFYLINHYKHISFGGFALFIIFVLIFLRNLKGIFPLNIFLDIHSQSLLR